MTQELVTEIVKADKDMNYNVHICFERHKDTTEEDWYVWLAAMYAIDADWPFAKWSIDTECPLKKCTECGGYEWIDPIVSPPDFIALAQQFGVKFQQLQWRDGKKCQHKEKLREQLAECFDTDGSKSVVDQIIDKSIDHAVREQARKEKEEEQRLKDWYLATKASEAEARRYHGEDYGYDPDLGDMYWH